MSRRVVMTHIARAERRKQMADAVLLGASVAATARKFNVTVATVRGACDQSGVSTKTKQHAGIRTFRVLAALLDGEGCMDISRRLRVSQQWVSSVRSRAIAAGIKLMGGET